MHTSLQTALLGIAIISTAATASAVQLASFTPRLEISNAQCRAAYTTNIDGCVAGDFTSGGKCSDACFKGLEKIQDVIKRVCRDVDLGETSIIGVFQNGLGPKALCPQTSPPASSSTTATSSRPGLGPVPPPSTSSSPAAPPSSTLVTSSSTSTSTSTSTSESEIAQSSSSSLGLVVDPNPTSISGGSPTEVAPPPASSTRAAAPPPNAQLSNADSGGGSPFDVVAISAASSHSRVIDLAMAAFIGTAVLFVGCA